MATAKSVALARELIDVWSKQVSASFSIIAETFEAVTGNPIITLANAATPLTTQKTAVLRIRPVTWTATDILGNAAQMFCPHLVDLCTELQGGAASYLTPAELLPILGELGKRGLMVNWYQTPQATVPAVAQMTAAQLTATYSDLYWSAEKAQ